MVCRTCRAVLAVAFAAGSTSRVDSCPLRPRHDSQFCRSRCSLMDRSGRTHADEVVADVFDRPYSLGGYVVSGADDRTDDDVELAVGLGRALYLVAGIHLVPCPWLTCELVIDRLFHACQPLQIQLPSGAIVCEYEKYHHRSRNS